jgi:hypothetical protein
MRPWLSPSTVVSSKLSVKFPYSPHPVVGWATGICVVVLGAVPLIGLCVVTLGADPLPGLISVSNPDGICLACSMDLRGLETFPVGLASTNEPSGASEESGVCRAVRVVLGIVNVSDPTTGG